MLYVSGITPDAVDAARRPARRGSATPRPRPISVLKQDPGGILKAQGYELGDVVMMRVLLVGDPAKGGEHGLRRHDGGLQRSSTAR